MSATAEPGRTSTDSTHAPANKQGFPPGPPPRKAGVVESLRYAAAFFFDPFSFVGSRFERYGDIYYAPSNGVGLYVLKHPDHIRDVLITQSDAFEKTHTAFESLSTVLGQGLLTTDGEVWRRHRRLLGPAFTKRAIEACVDRMVAETETTLGRMRIGAQWDVGAEMIDLTLRIVGRTLLGIDLASEVDTVGRSMRTFQMSLAVPRSTPKALKWPVDRTNVKALAALDGVIDRVIAARRASSIKHNDLLQMLLDAVDPEDASVRLSSREIRDELVTFLLAGHETTSNTLSWALSLIARSPEVERKLRQELDNVLGSRLPTAADVDKLVYTDRIVKEAMRLYPPAYVLARRAGRDATIGPYSVSHGSEVVIWTYFTHRDPRFYPEPTAFRPDRFAPEAEERRPKQSYLPFGAGPRACIGRAFASVEAVVALASLYQRFSFRHEERELPKARPRITLSPSSKLRLRFAAPR
ncbi:MAG: cytochrome P450 [Polyangiaceae bacterium]|nr:cytochrome P450 [Polyangiaceae bacterium]